MHSPEDSAVARLAAEVSKREQIELKLRASNDKLAEAVERGARAGAKDVYWNRTRMMGTRALKERPGDVERMWSATAAWLAPWSGADAG